jgi:hypothetical protein
MQMLRSMLQVAGVVLIVPFATAFCRPMECEGTNWTASIKCLSNEHLVILAVGTLAFCVYVAIVVVGKRAAHTRSNCLFAITCACVVAARCVRA